VLMRGDSHLGTARSPLKRLVKAVGYPPALRTFDAALYVGQRSRLYWEHYGFPNGRLFFAPHCVDNDWFEARGTKQAGLELRRKHSIADDAHVMLFAGKLIDFKRPLDVVEAAAYSAAQGMRVTVLVAGAGPLEDAMKRRATEAAVDLVMLGFCNQTQMPAAYAAADALVVASNAEETWGLVANEALACGTPIIVSDACGCSEDLCSDPEAGQSFPVGEHLALAHRFAEVIQSARSTVAPKKMAAAYSLAAAADGIELALAAVTR
jgi:glycosyltransferase involved in cell wall biosynthesis